MEIRTCIKMFATFLILSKNEATTIHCLLLLIISPSHSLSSKELKIRNAHSLSTWDIDYDIFPLRHADG